MVFQFIFLEMYFVNFSVNIVRYAHCNFKDMDFIFNMQDL